MKAKRMGLVDRKRQMVFSESKRRIVPQIHNFTVRSNTIHYFSTETFTGFLRFSPWQWRFLRKAQLEKLSPETVIRHQKTLLLDCPQKLLILIVMLQRWSPVNYISQKDRQCSMPYIETDLERVWGRKIGDSWRDNLEEKQKLPGKNWGRWSPAKQIRTENKIWSQIGWSWIILLKL